MKIPSIIKDLLKKTSFGKRQYIKQNGLLSIDEVKDLLDKAPKLFLGYKTSAKIGIVKERKEFESLVFPMTSWPKYERFCKNNNIEYGLIDITRSDWMDQVKKYDIIMWHTDSSPASQLMAETKIYIMEKEMGKLCFPSFHEVWQYENKIRAAYMYNYHSIPSIPTFVTNNKEDALNKIEKCDFPIIYKLSTGSGSKGVFKLNSKSSAVKLINRIFKYGQPTYWGYVKTKNEFYMQEFIHDATYDLRVMMVDDMAFGYFRYPKAGDFKASGSHIFEKKEIPAVALKLAYSIKNKLHARQIGVDMLYSTTTNQYYIIETSTFNQIDSPEQLVVNGVPGYYDLSDINNIKFKEGRFWIQELTLKSVIDDWTKRKKLN